jgi:hypothetical protein
MSRAEVLSLPLEAALIHLDHARKARVHDIFDHFGTLTAAMPFGDSSSKERWMDETAASVGLPSPRTGGLLSVDDMELDPATQEAVDEINREATERLKHKRRR